MQDWAEGPGAASLTIRELYQRVDRLRSLGQTCKVAVVYLEVRNDAVRNALCPNGRSLCVRGDPAECITISSLTIHKVKKAGALLDLLLKGNKGRAQRVTDINAESSRSHTIFQVYVTLTGTVTGKPKGIRVPKVSFVDLPDSEHAAAVRRNIKNRLCATKIELSFVVLGNSIDDLTNNGSLTNSEEKSCPARLAVQVLSAMTVGSARRSARHFPAVSASVSGTSCCRPRSVTEAVEQFARARIACRLNSHTKWDGAPSAVTAPPCLRTAGGPTLVRTVILLIMRWRQLWTRSSFACIVRRSVFLHHSKTKRARAARTQFVDVLLLRATPISSKLARKSGDASRSGGLEAGIYPRLTKLARRDDCFKILGFGH
ncbi:hypothetical protein HPB49_022244 [Dermacentor silvarum]|uniref:Uncharacterized protein n=1 Tax=Dermacentor silvarum TaxID=543639 RepID=A0ACB8E3J6_DERSI|nr:hypothetical protein HPB49_022244 [Dermacentor silvarum]